jgi:glutathione synthase/RimK-type ligase-like ATP-grasp enzyme
LVFSPFVLAEYRPKGGTVYAGRGCSKLDQIERLSRQGLPVPRTAKLTRDLTIDPVLWGQYVVAKPLRGGMGRDVYLVPTSEVAERYAVLTLNDTREMIIQPYIEHSENEFPTEYRVLTLFGKTRRRQSGPIWRCCQ